MSRHYWVATTVNLGDTTNVQKRAITKLAASDPLFASKLAKLDWNELRQEALVKAMQQCAKDGYSYRAKPSLTHLPDFTSNETVLAALEKESLFLLLTKSRSGNITFHRHQYNPSSGPEDPAIWKRLEQLQAAVMQAYIIESSKTLAALIGTNLTITNLSGGKTKFTVDLKGKP